MMAPASTKYKVSKKVIKRYLADHDLTQKQLAQLLTMPGTKEKREAVEFLRTHRCADEGCAYKTVGDCHGCIKASRALFGNDDALCNLDSSGPGMWQRLADLIDDGGDAHGN